jgi:hypothetical protein
VQKNVIYPHCLQKVSDTARGLFADGLDATQLTSIKKNRKLRQKIGKDDDDNKTYDAKFIRLEYRKQRSSASEEPVVAWPNVSDAIKTPSYRELVGRCKDLAELESCTKLKLDRSWVFLANKGDLCIDRHRDGWAETVTVVVNGTGHFRGSGVIVYPAFVVNYLP